MSSGTRWPAAVIFDLDGVLLQSEPVWVRAKQDAIAAIGGQWDPAWHRQTMGMAPEEWSAYIAQRVGPGWTPAQIRTRVVCSLLSEYKLRLPVVPDAVDTIDWLRRRGLPLAIASSSDTRILAEVVRALGAREWFKVIVSSEEVEKGKPDPAVYLEACRRLGVSPGRAIAVEDSAPGILSASRAGLRVWACPNRDYPPSADALSHCETVLASLSDLPKLLAR